MRAIVVRQLAVFGILAAIVVAFPISAQAPPPGPTNPPPVGVGPSATSAPHPSMPWSGYGPNYGQVVREIPVAPQPVTIEVAVPAAEGQPKQSQTQVVQIPGYVVIETTTGYAIPERYTLEQVGPGAYQWRKLPAEFRKK